MVPLKPAERYKQFWSESVDKKREISLEVFHFGVKLHFPFLDFI